MTGGQGDVSPLVGRLRELAPDLRDFREILRLVKSRAWGDAEHAEGKVLLRERFEALRVGDAPWQRRGYTFERLLCLLLALEGLDPSPGYRPEGEQVDGFFIRQGRYFLLESKWERDEQPASELYAFRGKVDGRLSGTIGTFVSMSGFAADAPKALRYGKELNILLFDSTDIEYAFAPSCSFSAILNVKMREAARLGEIYFTYQRHLDLLRI